MAGNADFINILRDIRGSAAPGQPATDGIWYELTIADKNGNPGIYGDILAKYGVVTESAGTFDQAVAILENLNVEVTTLPAGSQATSALVNGVWQIGIPRGTAGINGTDGFTPVVGLNYSLGNLNYTVTVDGVQITNAALVNLDGLVDTRVNANVDVQTTLAAKQDVLNAVATAQAIADGLNVNVANKIVQLDAHTTIKVGELNVASAAEQLELAATADAKKLEYYQNAVVKTAQYDANHTTKLNEYNANDALKIEQYNANHLERLENLDTQYADRIVDMLNTNKILGMVDKFAAKTPTEYATFIDTTNGNYLYYLNGVLLTEFVGYAVTNNTTIHLTNPIAYGDVVTQVDSRYVGDYLNNEGVILEERIGQPNGVAGLDENGQVPSTQLPSYVDDVLEFANLVSFPATGESGKIYIAIDTNLTYRWGGSSYVVMSSSLALGETSSTAYRGDRGKIAYDHSQTTGNPHNTKVEELSDVSGTDTTIVDTDVILKKDTGGIWKKITFANFKNWFTTELAKKINIGLDTIFNFKNISAMPLSQFRSIIPNIETIYFTEEQNSTGWQQIRYNGLGITIPATTETLIALTNENFIELDSDSTFNLIDVANTKINGIFEKDFVIIKFKAGVVTPATTNQWFKVILKINDVKTAISPVFYLTESSGTIEQIAHNFALNVPAEMVTNGATLHLKTSASLTFNNPAISVLRVHKSTSANL